MISDVGKWMNGAYGDVTFHLSQVLSGHGAFNYYLHRFNIVGSDTCAQCSVTPDDAKYAIFINDNWHKLRRDTCGEI